MEPECKVDHQSLICYNVLPSSHYANLHHFSGCKVDMSGCKFDHQSRLHPIMETNLTSTYFPLYLPLFPHLLIPQV